MKLPTRELQVQELSSDPAVKQKQKELLEVNERIDQYKREIERMRKEL
jgi:hypothetical protein